ncbi:PAS domain-containing protein [Massilia sp. CCM 8692]|uniref:histidine kinase n=2 Tax=Massilia rubra TaxID=2607910 RepID=A0ABX0LP11_9BURK|nr:PAS domain-containing protein [Massilia rubra]
MRLAMHADLSNAPGVRVRLAALVLGSVLPLAAIGVFLIENLYATERRQLIEDTRARVRAITAALDREFDSTIVALQALGTSRMLEAGDLAGFHSRARSALVNMRADSIVLVGADGALLMSTRRPFGQALPKLRSTPLLRSILASGQPGVSDLFIGPLSGDYIYSMGVPIRQGGSIVMTLNATATHAQLAQVLKVQGLPGNWRAALVDRNGLVAARSHAIEKFLAKEIPPALKARLAAHREDAVESQTLDGIRVYTVFSRSASSGWTAIVGIPLDELTQGLYRSLRWLIAATVGALGIGLALAWRIGGQIASSVQALVEPAHALGQQARQAIPPLYFREANELGTALTRAGQDLHGARAARRESEERLALAASAARLGIWVRDLDSGALWTSPDWRVLFAFDPTHEVGIDDFMRRIHPDDRAGVQATLAQALAARQRYETEYRIELPDGSLRWIGSQGNVEADASGKARLLRGVSFDISTRRRAELDIEQMRKEVTHLARVALMGELTGAMAHELNQPLTSILSNAQAALRYLRQQPPRLDQVHAILADIVSEDERAGQIIERLRRLFDKRETLPQPVAIDTLVAEVAHLLRNDLINHGVILALDLGAGAAVVDADKVQLQQVLINLLINACDAMAERGKDDSLVLLRSALGPERTVLLSVCDSGAGIAPAAMAQLFTPFFTTKTSGMGLGLSICRNIAQAHGGRLWAENNAGPGATFYLSLPLRAPLP